MSEAAAQEADSRPASPFHVTPVTHVSPSARAHKAHQRPESAPPRCLDWMDSVCESAAARSRPACCGPLTASPGTGTASGLARHARPTSPYAAAAAAVMAKLQTETPERAARRAASKEPEEKGVLREMVTAFQQLEAYHAMPTKEIWICKDDPAQAAKALMRATVPDVEGNEQGKAYRVLKPNWAPALPPRVDYTLYLETKKDKSVARRVRIGKIKASTLKKALHKAALTLPFAPSPPDYRGWAAAAIQGLTLQGLTSQAPDALMSHLDASPACSRSMSP